MDGKCVEMFTICGLYREENQRYLKFLQIILMIINANIITKKFQLISLAYSSNFVAKQQLMCYASICSSFAYRNIIINAIKTDVKATLKWKPQNAFDQKNSIGKPQK